MGSNYGSADFRKPLTDPWALQAQEGSKVAHEAYALAFKALMEGNAPEHVRQQLADVVHQLSMASMRLRNIVWWEEGRIAVTEYEIDQYAHFRAVVS